MQRGLVWWGGVATIAALGVLACTGEDPRPVVEVTDAGGTLSADAAPSLGCPLGCLPPAPPGWKGPSAVYDGPADVNPQCEGFFGLREVEALEGAKGDETACSCGEANATGFSCKGTVRRYATTGCGGAPSQVEIPGAGACVELKSFMSADFAFVPDTQCVVATKEGPRPPVTYAKRAVACGLTQVASCTGRADCTATPLPLVQPFTRLCLHQEGETLCPSADYAVRFVEHRSVKDDRTCNPCVAAGQGGSCTFEVFAQNSADCNDLSGPVTSPVNTATCQPSGTPAMQVQPVQVTDKPKCVVDPMTGKPSGTVTPTEPVTFCCNR